MIDYAKIKPYVRSIRPTMPDSLPRYTDQELDKIGRLTITLLQALQDLNNRIAALETP